MIAGLEDITSGELLIGGQVVNQKSPKDRDIAMVFQNYALYPHMTVRENMGFALKLAKTPEGRDQPEGRGGGADPGPDPAPGPQAGQPLRRPAPAGGHGPGHRPRPGRVPDGRAAVQPGRQAAGADAHRGIPAAAAAGHHHGVRHARPDRGPDPRRPGRGPAQRRAAAGGLAAGTLRPAGQPVRGRVHRLAVDELHGRHPGRRQAAHPARRYPGSGQLHQDLAVPTPAGT